VYGCISQLYAGHNTSQRKNCEDQSEHDAGMSKTELPEGGEAGRINACRARGL